MAEKKCQDQIIKHLFSFFDVVPFLFLENKVVTLLRLKLTYVWEVLLT